MSYVSDTDNNKIILSKQFLNGLREKNITHKEVIDYYVYCGGLTNIDRDFSPDYYSKYYNNKEDKKDSRHLKYLRQYYNYNIPYNRLPICENLKSFYRRDPRIVPLYEEYYEKEYDFGEIFLKKNCICKQSIKHLCFLHNKNYKDNKKPEYLLVGSCCITKFMPNGLEKTCSKCGEIHQNRKDNFCNNCREELKDIMIVSKWNCYIDINNNYYCKKYKDIPTEYLEWALNHSPYLNNPNESLSSKSNKDKIRRYIEHRINESNQ